MNISPTAALFQAFLSRTFGFAVLASLLVSTQAQAIENWEYKLDLDYGMRVDQLNWNIAGNLAGSGPNVISELRWNNVKFHQTSLGYRFIGDDRWYIKGYISKAWGFSGSFEDSDYNGDNRSLEYSRSSGDSNRSTAEDYSIAIGQQIRIDNRIGVTPLVGFSSHRQSFTMTNGTQMICDASGSPNSCNNGLNSTFTTHWRGPWLGLDLRVATAKRWTTYAELEYHYSYYDAYANDLDHPISYSQSAIGQGTHLGLGLSYAMSTPDTFLNIGFKQSRNSTQAGTHYVHNADDTISSQRLNKVNWSSSMITIGITSQY